MWADGASPSTRASTAPPDQLSNSDFTAAENGGFIRVPTPPPPFRGFTSQTPCRWAPADRRGALRFVAPSGVRCNNWFGGNAVVVVQQHQPTGPERDASPVGATGGDGPEQLYPVYAPPTAPRHSAQQHNHQQQQQRLGSPEVSEYDEPTGFADTAYWPGDSNGPFGDSNRTSGAQCGLVMWSLHVAAPQGMRFIIRRRGKWCA